MNVGMIVTRGSGGVGNVTPCPVSCPVRTIVVMKWLVVAPCAVSQGAHTWNKGELVVGSMPPMLYPSLLGPGDVAELVLSGILPTSVPILRRAHASDTRSHQHDRATS